MGARRGGRQGLRARQRPVRHLRPGLPRLPASRTRTPWARRGRRLLPEAHRAPQEAARRPAARRKTRVGVAVVRAQLDAWCAGVGYALEALARRRASSACARACAARPLIWRQLLAGDKEPEAYLDRHARAGAARRHARADLAPLPALGARAGCGRCVAVALAWPHLRRRQLGARRRPPARSGSPRRRVLLTVRGRVDQWSSLLWERALAHEDRRGDARRSTTCSRRRRASGGSARLAGARGSARGSAARPQAART